MIPIVARAKGIFRFAGDPQAVHTFQLVGRRWSLEPFIAAGRSPKTRIVAIAPADRKAQLSELFAALRRL